MNKRKDEVYRKLVDEYTTVENAPFGNIKYHKSCYKAFTSKQNLSTCSNFKSTRPTSASCNQNPSSNEDNFTIVIRSRASKIDWTACIFCKHKAFKHDRKMHKVSSFKCVRADLTHELEREVCPSFILPSFDKTLTVLIRDGMGIIQSLDVKKFSNFGDLAMLFQSAETIVYIFDRYDLKDSIKSAERELRSQAAGGHRIYHVNEGSSIPDWKKFLSNNRNKQELISFLGEFISKFVNTDNPCLLGQTLYLAGNFRNPEVMKKIAGDQVTDCRFVQYPRRGRY